MIRHDDEFVEQILPLVAIVEEHVQQKRYLSLVTENRPTLPCDCGHKESALTVHSSNLPLMDAPGMCRSSRKVVAHPKMNPSPEKVPTQCRRTAPQHHRRATL